MSSNPNAEKSAPRSIVSNQGTGPTTSPELSINRDPVEQGNTTAEKNLNTLLDDGERDKLIQAAIQKTIPFPVLTWGSIELYSLLSYGEEHYVGTDDGKAFFLQLLLFVAKPEIAEAFHKAVDDGLEIIGKLTGFFNDLDTLDNYQEFIDYSRIEIGTTDERYRNIAKRYLSGVELKQVLGPSEEPKSTSHKLFPSWYMTPEEENSLILTDDELVAALDRYHPGVQWPADKKTIATHEKMRSQLTYREKERLAVLTETPEQKQKRLIDAAVYSELNGPSIPEQIRSIGDKVAAAVQSPKVLGPDTKILFRLDKIKAQPLSMDPEKTSSLASVKKPVGAVTTRKPVSSPTKKPAPSKKPAIKKKA